MTSTLDTEQELSLLTRRLAMADQFQFNILIADPPELLHPTLLRLLDGADARRGHAIPRLWMPLAPSALGRPYEALLDALLLPIWDHQVQTLTACVWDLSDAQEFEADAWLAAFARLNQLRNHVIQRVPGPLLLAAPTWLLLLFLRAAADFWSIRGVQVQVTQPPRALLAQRVDARRALPHDPSPWPALDLLVIADLRMDPAYKARAASERARDALLERLRERRPDVILFAGNLTAAGTAAQMDHFDGYFHGHLQAAWGLAPERVLYAPGPSDALRALPAPEDTSLALAFATDDERERVFQDLHALTALTSRFHPYQALVALTRLGRQQGLRPASVWAWTLPVEDRRVGIAVFNSALLGQEDGRGELLAPQLLQAQRLLDQQGAQVRVALLHHAPSRWRDPSSPEAEALLALFDLVLTAADEGAAPAQGPLVWQAPLLRGASPGWLWLHLGASPWFERHDQPPTLAALPPLRLDPGVDRPWSPHTARERHERLHLLRLSALASAASPEERLALQRREDLAPGLIPPPDLTPRFYGAALQAYLQLYPRHAPTIQAALPAPDEPRARWEAITWGNPLREHGDYDLAYDLYAAFLPDPLPELADVPSNDPALAALLHEVGLVRAPHGQREETSTPRDTSAP